MSTTTRKREHKKKRTKVVIPTVIQLKSWDKIFNNYGWDHIKLKVLEYLRKRLPMYKWEPINPSKVYIINGEPHLGTELVCGDDFATHYIGINKHRKNVLVAHFCFDTGTIYISKNKCPALNE